MGLDYKDYYRILGIDKRADEREIKAAFRRMARRYHPDVNPGDAAAEQHFKDVNEAYEVLSDPEKRRRYDILGPVNWMRANGSAPRASTARPGQSTFDFFQNVFSAANARRARARKGRDLEQDVTITLEEAFSGSTRVFNIQGEEQCERCDGSGRSPSGQPCPTCAGSGLVAYSRKIEVRVPAGVRDGSRIRIANEGGAGSMGGSKGDLYFRIHVRPHERFRRDEDNLTLEMDVPLTTLVLGGEIDVPTLARPVRMKVPPTTANGRQFRLARQGMPHLNAGGHGDLIVRVNAALPQQLSDRERRLYEELRELSRAGA
jgi:DnaJ-class molecular chaperone